ncbi:MAG: C1 family peptidase [Candidatus Aureabacteria bacterium]|nr:C1 family peptidase [Candidatus Auribacterota bacterium]
MKSAPFIAVCVVLASRSASAAYADPLPIGPDDTIEEIRFKIEENGWRFRVERNRFFDSFRERQSSRPLFAGPVPAAAREMGPLRRFLGRVSLPSRFDWRNRGGHSYIGPIRDQQIPCSSCYAFGSCAAAEGTYNLARGRYDENCADFSESFVMWCLGVHGPYGSLLNGCSCGDPLWALQAMTRQGVCFEASFTYQTDDPGSCAHWSDETIAFQSWHLLPENDVAAIKTAIMTFGVVLAGVAQTAAWDAYAGGVYEDGVADCVNADGQIGHAVSLVGWDDDPPEGGGGCWILRNQFGTDWGEDGYMRISYLSAYVSCRRPRLRRLRRR